MIGIVLQAKLDKKIVVNLVRFQLFISLELQMKCGRFHLILQEKKRSNV